MDSQAHLHQKEFTSLEDASNLLQSSFPGRTDTHLCNELTVYEQVSHQVFVDHVEGRNRLGIFPLIGHRCQWGLIDIDELNRELALAVQREAARHKISLSMEQSRRKGYHLWLFLSDWIEGWKVRAVLEMILNDLNIKAEVIPKQDDTAKTKKGVGTGGFLPWFNLAAQGPKNKFLDSSNGLSPYADQLAFLRNVVKTDLARIDGIVEINNLEQQESRSSQDKHIPKSKMVELLKPLWKVEQRYHLTMYLSGFLAKSGWGSDSAIYVITELTDFSHDEEKESRLRVVRDTYEKHSRGEEIKGYEGLKEILDESTLAELIEIMREETPWLIFSKTGKVTFLPGLLAEHLSQHERSIYLNGSIYIYDGGVYNRINDDNAREIISQHIPDNYRKTSWVTDTLAQWRCKVLTSPEKVNPPNCINLKNGLYNWVEGEFRNHDPASLSTIQLNASYDPNVKCPRFMQFLGEVLERETIPLIQEIFGYCLTDLTVFQKAFILLGSGANGKSTLMSVLQELIGKQNVAHVPLQEIEERFNSSQLYMKLLNCFADLDQQALKSTSIFKIIVGEDWLMGEEKFKDKFSFKPFCKLIYSCNQLPRTIDRSHAYYRRYIILPFNNKFEGDKANPLLREELFEELDGILIWALKGLERLLDQGRFSETEITRKALNQYKEENSSVISFVKDCCFVNTKTRDLNSWVWKKDLSLVYRFYCQMNNLHPVSGRAFNKELREAYPNVEESVKETKTIWRNIVLADEWKEEIISKKMDEKPSSKNETD